MLINTGYWLLLPFCSVQRVTAVERPAQLIYSVDLLVCLCDCPHTIHLTSQLFFQTLIKTLKIIGIKIFINQLHGRKKEAWKKQSLWCLMSHLDQSVKTSWHPASYTNTRVTEWGINWMLLKCHSWNDKVSINKMWDKSPNPTAGGKSTHPPIQGTGSLDAEVWTPIQQPK